MITGDFQQEIAALFMVYPLIIIIIMKVVVKLPIEHPFILVLCGLILMGLGLSTTDWVFNIGVVATLCFSIYSVLSLPTIEILEANNLIIRDFKGRGKSTTIMGNFYQKWLKRA